MILYVHSSVEALTSTHSGELVCCHVSVHSPRQAILAVQTESRCVVSPEGSNELQCLDTEQAAVFQWVTVSQVEMYWIQAVPNDFTWFIPNEFATSQIVS